MLTYLHHIRQPPKQERNPSGELVSNDALNSSYIYVVLINLSKRLQSPLVHKTTDRQSGAQADTQLADRQTRDTCSTVASNMALPTRRLTELLAVYTTDILRASGNSSFSTAALPHCQYSQQPFACARQRRKL